MLAWLGVAAVATLGVTFLLLKTKVPKSGRPKSGVPPNNQTYVVPGPERIHRSQLSRDKLIEYVHEDARTLWEGFLRGRKVSQGSGFLGTRPTADGPFEWQTYDEVYERVCNFASGLVHLGIAPGQKTFVGIYCQNRAEWVIAEHAANSMSMILVPLYDTLGVDAVKFIVNQAQIAAIICDEGKFANTMAVLKDCKSIRLVVKMGKVSEADVSQGQLHGKIVESFEAIEKLGSQHRTEPVPPKPDDVATICYTSGTTGDPKGAMLTHGNIVADYSSADILLSASNQTSFQFGPEDYHISYLPLAHMFERVVQAWLTSRGAHIGFFRGDIKTLTQDIAALRPTIFPSVPRLLNRMFDKVMAGVQSASPLKKFLFNTALNAKREEVRRGIIRNNSIWDLLVFSKVQKALGGRVKIVITGAAPISEATLDFLRCAFGCPVLEGYGQTECTAAAFITLVDDTVSGHVGSVLPCCEVKLDSVPDMNYHAKDDAGEICFRGPNVMKGYLNSPEKTKEAIDEDGWLHSGDIGRWLPNGALKIVDRKKAIFKLAQGEYIAPEKIENVYLRSEPVAQIFVYGSSLEASLVAVVVPDVETLSGWVKKTLPEVNASLPFAELCNNKQVEKAVLNDLLNVGKQAKLHSFEQVRVITLCSDLFSVENGLLTPTFKAKRPQLQERFKAELSALYDVVHSQEKSSDK